MENEFAGNPEYEALWQAEAQAWEEYKAAKRYAELANERWEACVTAVREWKERQKQ